MKKYITISPFVERDKDGVATGKYAKMGQRVQLTPQEAHRLMLANCVEEIEARVVKSPENRKRKRSRASKS